MAEKNPGAKPQRQRADPYPCRRLIYGRARHLAELGSVYRHMRAAAGDQTVAPCLRSDMIRKAYEIAVLADRLELRNAPSTTKGLTPCNTMTD